MVSYFFSSPGIYYLIGLVVIISSIIYWKRDLIKKELRRWRLREASAGPVTFERQDTDNEDGTSKSTGGVHFGEGPDFTGAKVNNIAGRDIRRQNSSTSSEGEEYTGVNFGKNGKFRDAKIKNVAGRDLEE